MVNVKPVQLGKTTRMSFGKIDEVLPMPNLIEVQKKSYEWFLNEGLKEVLHDMSSITDYNGNYSLSFVDFKLADESNYSIAKCKELDVTYSAKMFVKAKVWDRTTGDIYISLQNRTIYTRFEAWSDKTGREIVCQSGWS